MAWSDLTMSQRAEVIQMAVKNGMRDLNQIRSFYDKSIGSLREYKKGGYLDWKKKASRYKHLNIDNDRTYDYEGWYNENPQRAWDFLNDSPDAHFDDKYKTVYHPTFSTHSKYSGVIDSKFNPQGLVGGTWSKDNHTFTMSSDGYRGPVSMDERKTYLENAEDNGVQLREADGSLPIYDNIIWGGVLPAVTVKPFYDSSVNKFAMGGPEETIVAPSDNTRVNYSPSVYVGDSQEVQDVMNKSVAAEGNFAYGTLRFLPYSRWITDALDATGISPDINKPDLTDVTQTVSHLGNGYFNGVAKMESMQKPGTYRKSYTTRGVLDRKPKRKTVTYTIDQNDINAAVKKAKTKANIFKGIGAIGLIGDFTQMLENTRDLINAEQKYNNTSNKVFNERVKTHPAVKVKSIGN